MDFAKTVTLLDGLDASMMETEHLRGTAEADEDELTELLEQLKEKLTPLIRGRAAIKRKLTLLIKSVCGLENVSSVTIKSTLKKYDECMQDIKKFSDRIDEVYLLEEFIKLNADQHTEEQINSALYDIKMGEVRAELYSQIPSIAPSTSTPTSTPAAPVVGAVGGAILGGPREAKLPPLKCGGFSGEADRDFFRVFQTQFQNIIGYRSDISGASKLLYLRGYLKGAALQEVAHLSNTDANYEVAWSLLKKAYLDIPSVVSSLQHKLHAPFDFKAHGIEGLRGHLAQVRANLHELKELGSDLMIKDSAACSLASHLITDGLPSCFLKEL